MNYTVDTCTFTKFVVCCRHQRSFHGVNLTSLHDVALQEYFHQPVVVSAKSEVFNEFAFFEETGSY